MRSMDWSVWVVMPMTGRRCILWEPLRGIRKTAPPAEQDRDRATRYENCPSLTTAVYTIDDAFGSAGSWSLGGSTVNLIGKEVRMAEQETIELPELLGRYFWDYAPGRLTWPESRHTI